MPTNPHCVYRATNIVNGKSYIGYTSEFPRRKRIHERAYGNCPKFHAAMRKYGADKFLWQIIYKGSDALEKEQYFIEQYNTIDDGYNLCEGGGTVMTGRKHSKEARDKMSKAQKNRDITHWIGKKHKESTKKKMADAKAMSWDLISPEGEYITITNMAKFCRENNLDRASLHKVVKGKRQSHHGWRVV